MTMLKMTNYKNVQIFGESCGKHGTYTFYPGLQFTHSDNHQTNYLTLGKFFHAILPLHNNNVTNSKYLQVIGELQLVWHDKNYLDGDLCSVKFYVRPEDCPGGRQAHHGEDELVAEENKVVLRLSELLDLLPDEQPTTWNHSHNHQCNNNNNNNNIDNGLNNNINNVINNNRCKSNLCSHKATNKNKLKKLKSDANKVVDNGRHLILPGNLDFKQENNNNDNDDDDGDDEDEIGDDSFTSHIASHESWYAGSSSCRVTPKQNCPLKKPLVLSFPQYCRYQGAVKRLKMINRQNDMQMLAYLLGRSFVQSLPGVVDNVEVHFCKDTIIMSDLKSFKSELSHLAPRLKGRKRKKKNYSKYFESDDSNESEVYMDQIVLRKTSNRSSHVSFEFPALVTPSKRKKIQSEGRIHNNKSKIICTSVNTSSTTTTTTTITSTTSTTLNSNSTTSNTTTYNTNNILSNNITITINKSSTNSNMTTTTTFNHSNNLVNDKNLFLDKLYKFMNDNQSPISKNPILGFKEVDLHQFYVSTHKRGGYDQVTRKRLWKEIYVELGGSACNTSAATGTRKNYEKYLQPFENFLKNITPGPHTGKKCIKRKTKASSLSPLNEDDLILPYDESPTKTLMKLNFNKEPFIVIRPVCNNMMTTSSSLSSSPSASCYIDKLACHSKIKKPSQASSSSSSSSTTTTTTTSSIATTTPSSTITISTTSSLLPSNFVESSHVPVNNNNNNHDDDVVVCNPPFTSDHQTHIQSDVITVSRKLLAGGQALFNDDVIIPESNHVVLVEDLLASESKTIPSLISPSNSFQSNIRFTSGSFVSFAPPTPTTNSSVTLHGKAFVMSSSYQTVPTFSTLTSSLSSTSVSLAIASPSILPSSSTSVTITTSSSTSSLLSSFLLSSSLPTLMKQQMKPTSSADEPTVTPSSFMIAMNHETSNSLANVITSQVHSQAEQNPKDQTSTNSSQTMHPSTFNHMYTIPPTCHNILLLKCADVGDVGDETPTDLSMKTMKKLEEEIQMKMLNCSEQVEPLDLSKKCSRVGSICDVKIIDVDNEFQQPLDLTKSSKQQNNEDFKPNVTLPMNLAQLLPLAFAMPFSSNLQVNPRQILSPIQQNINMIYNPGSINFPILSFNPTSSYASVKP